MGDTEKKTVPGDTASTVLFADICGSTSLYDTLGNLTAQRLVTECLRCLSGVAVRHKGRVVKNIGDEILCVFPDSDRAVEAARDMHLMMQEKYSVTPAGKKLTIRIGLQRGQIVHEANDVYGDAVNVAARITNYAKSRQILTTEEVVQSLNAVERTMVRHIDAATLKGKREQLNIYEVVWDGQGLTVVVQNPEFVKGRELALILIYKDQRTQVDRSRTGISIGRHHDNDMVVEDAYTSRTHALINFINGKFILADTSTNGTYLITGDKSTYLHMDQYPLQTSGAISLGRLLPQDSIDVIRFNVEQR